MNDYSINLTASKPQQILFAEATGIWFVSGTSSTSENRVKVKFSNSDEFALKPGQSVIGLPKTGMVSITSYDGSSVIDGFIKLGTGRFEDSNIQSTTTIAPGQTVGISGNVNVTNKLPAMTAGWAQTGALTAGTAVQIVSAAANVNGIVVHAAQVQHTGNGRQSFLAKATAPATAIDGIVILSHDYVGAASQYDLVLGTNVTIPAGMGLYYFPTGDPNGRFRSISYTVL
ncbi:hypothetical protein [Undibacterium sp.]|uniref:hypothetical protein n=1 Tax=Undibacterium sp. TaxID=1914977 RepID=UPI00272EFA9F|nr:hypothetical protein [Undibacterium sp.]MDP1978045.1 hypothetical protein [Undibacterium sp.]